MEAELLCGGTAAIGLPAAVAGTILTNALLFGSLLFGSFDNCRTLTVADCAKELGTAGAFTWRQN